VSEQTHKFFIDASFNHLIEVKNNGDALLTIHNDGTITAAEHLKPTETAAAVLQIMREQWMADIQSKKIREQEDRIKRLEEALGCVVVSCNHLHHRKKHQHKLGEPCPVEGLIRKAKEAKP
jgi:phosphoribosylformylglycinamidine (FGAM) synthase-like enzyme